MHRPFAHLRFPSTLRSLGRPRAASTRRLHAESLEERQLLAVDFAQFAQALTGDGGALESLAADVAHDVLAQYRLPLVGTGLGDVLSLFEDWQGSLGDQLVGLAEDAGEDELRDAIYGVLGPAGAEVLADQNGNGVDPNDVLLSVNIEDGTIDLELGLAGTVVDIDLLSTDVFGVDALPVELLDALDLELTVSYSLQNLHLVFNPEADLPLDLVLEDLETFQLVIDVGIAEGAEASANFGFLEVTIADSEVQPSGAGVTFDLSLGEAGPQFSVVDAHAGIGLHVTASAGSVLPAASFDVQYGWYGHEAFDAPPEFAVTHVSLELGATLSTILEPVVTALEPVLEPIGTLLGFLQEDIPGLSQLGINVTALDILQTVGEVGSFPPEVEAIFELLPIIVQFGSLLDDLSCEQDGCVIELPGSVLNLPGGADLRMPELSAQSVSDLKPDALGDLSGVELVVGGSQFGLDELADAIENLGAGSLAQQVRDLNNGFSVSTLLDDIPGNVARLIMGQQVDLLRLDLAYDSVGNSADPFDTPIGLNVDIGLNTHLNTDIGFGIDLAGIVSVLQGQENASLFQGLYFDAGSHITFDAQLGASVGVGSLFFNAGVEAALEGALEISVPAEADTNGDGKVRLVGEVGSCMVHVGGDLSFVFGAFVQVGVEILGKFLGWEKHFDFVDAEIFSFNLGCVGNPFDQPEDPVLAHFDPATGNLILLVGDLVDGKDMDGDLGVERNVAPDETDEGYYVSRRANGDLAVQFHGVTQIFGADLDIVRIVADAGKGDDTLVASDSVDVPVIWHGGDGNDKLQYLGSADGSELHGESGNDVLRGGIGQELLTGGEGDDALYGGANDDTLLGGAGNDQLHGDSGNDSLQGGAGDDFLDGGEDSDSIYGDAGNDDLYGGIDEGVSSDAGYQVLVGGSGDDRLTAGPNGDVMNGEFGNDDYYTNLGDDFIIESIDHSFTVNQVFWERGDGNTSVNLPGIFARNLLSLAGTEAAESFHVQNGTLDGILEVLTPDGILVTAQGIHNLNVDGRDGADDLFVAPLRPVFSLEVSLNMSDNLAPDNQSDLIRIETSQLADMVTIDSSLDAILQQPSNPDYPRRGGIMTAEIGNAEIPNATHDYRVRLMNFEDDVRLFSRAGADKIVVQGITGPTRVETGDGKDSIEVHAAEIGDLEMIPAILPDFMADLTIDAGADENSLSVSQLLSPRRGTLEIGDADFQSDLIPGIHYEATGGSFGATTFEGTNLDDRFSIRSTVEKAFTTIAPGDGKDELIVSSNAPATEGDLNQIRGTVFFAANQGVNVISLIDRGSTSANSQVVVDHNSIVGMAGDANQTPILYAAAPGTLELNLFGSNAAHSGDRFVIDGPQASLSVSGEDGPDTFRVQSTQNATALHGGAGRDVFTIRGDLANLTGPIQVSGGRGFDRVAVNAAATPGGRVFGLSPQQMETLFVGSPFRVNYDAATEVVDLVGTPGSDRFVVESESALPGTLNGGSGNDILDYANWSDGVEVDLSRFRASGISGRVLGIENVIGGSGDDLLIGNDAANGLWGGLGNDVLVGLAGNDLLLGEAGRDLLIGGRDEDQLAGGAGDDLLIGGNTSYDRSLAELAELRNEWTSGNSYARRINFLSQGGGANGSSILRHGLTVFDDEAIDQLFGEPGQDWFLIGKGDVSPDAKSSEVKS